jgi:Dolichyl-phosphate-mannose-protein mannosyltransferase
MEIPAAPALSPGIADPVWKFSWLTPGRCRAIFAAVLLYNFLSHWYFLTHNCPIDLSGDEAQYWDWSRHLDLSYYSKGPLIAYIIRASCAVLGDTMPAVRFPALLLAVGTSICSYWLTRKMFGSDRLALGTFLLGAVVPMYLAGSTLMTIDPPFFFLWALATCFAVKAIVDDRRWAWPVVGVIVGLGFLTKYSMLLWVPAMFLFLAIDRNSRRWLRSAWPWVMVIIALLFTTPVIVWNAQHHWVSLAHVSAQTATHQGNLPEFIVSQIAIVNPAIALLMTAAIIYALSRWGRSDPHRREMLYLICIGLPFFAACLLDSLISKVQGNWPAPAYFTLLILTTYFIATRMRRADLWRPWRGWFYGAIIFGLAIQPLLNNATAFYPLVRWADEKIPRRADGSPLVHLSPSNMDLSYKLRGIADPFAKTVGEYLSQLPAGSFILCEDYQDASQLAFYVAGQPKTYFVGSYWTRPELRRRLTQFDMWPDRQLDRQELIGKDAIYIGTVGYEPFRESWERIEKLPEITVVQNGMDIRSFPVWRCYGFKGMHRPDDGRTTN